MENAQTLYGKNGANLREITLDGLEKLTDLYLWGNVGASNFQNRRNKLNGGTWWQEGQPKPRTNATTKK
ncbi:MAG: hypothetical protein GKR96_14650 [Gammaproteobacteria bacterium]|nr:hypothetical protein [Gammaproteobacteria bacterium]